MDLLRAVGHARAGLRDDLGDHLGPRARVRRRSTTSSRFRKGANFTAAMAFEVASTNLVIELGIILALLIGWEFTAAEFIGGPAMIVILARGQAFGGPAVGSENCRPFANARIAVWREEGLEFRTKWYLTPAQSAEHARSARQARSAAQRARVHAAEARDWAAEAYERVLDRKGRPADATTGSDQASGR